MSIGWELDPVLIGGTLAVAVVALVGFGPLRARLAPGAPYPRGRAALFLSGLALFFLAVGSPLDSLSDRYLFSAHMVQHILLVYAVAPLLLGGLPAWLLRPVLANRVVRPVAIGLTRPVVALLLFSGLFSLWHLPGAFEAALHNETLHNAEHIGLIVLAMLMWWPVMGNVPEVPSLDYPGQILYLFVLPLAQFIVAAILTFDPNPMYATYIAAPRVWGLAPAADQQLGGIVMKVGSMLAFGVPLAVAGFRWFARENVAAVAPAPRAAPPSGEPPR